MAKAKKLPSGAWRARPFIGYDKDNKRMYKSFTADTKKEAEYMAAEYLMHQKESEKPSNLTVGAAMDRYIESKDAILSPSTINGYKRMRRQNLQGLMSIKLGALTKELIQREINKESKTLSPKTIRNIHGLLSAVLREYHPSLILNTSLPQKEKYDIYIPTKEEMATIYAAAQGTSIELPILLASCLGLRKSEILALKWEKINFETKTLTIDEAIVAGEKNELFTKSPKSFAGNRTIVMPDIVVESLKRASRESDYVVNLTSAVIYKRFIKILRDNNIQHFRFHDLRHYNASVMLALGVPDKYAMERMGHATNTMLKTVYQHTMQDKQDEVDQSLNNYFMHHEMHHDRQ